MAWRSAETPMEFEYDNKVGKLSNTPFGKMAQAKAGTLDRNFGSAFRSPSPTRTNSFPPPSGAAPQTPKNPVQTFRDRVEMEFSESSPDNGNAADSDNTPEPSSAKLDNVTVFRGNSLSAKAKTPPAKRLSWLQKLKSKQSTALIRKTHKRKRREVEHDDKDVSLRRTGQDDEDESSRPSSADGADGKQPNHASRNRDGKKMGAVASVLSFIHEHPHLPTILAFYGQMFFSLFILAMLGWGIWCVWGAVLQQIDVEAERNGVEFLKAVRDCEKQWLENRCDGDYVPPALRQQCDEWDHCSKMDWKARGRANIGASTFAAILNNFVDELSYKFIFCALAIVARLLFSPQQLFGQVRKANEAHIQQQQQQQQQPQAQQTFFPQTPSRQVHDEWINAGAYQTGFFTPQAQARNIEAGDWGSPSKRLEGRSRSPVKQLEFKKYS